MGKMRSEFEIWAREHVFPIKTAGGNMFGRLWQDDEIYYDPIVESKWDYWKRAWRGGSAYVAELVMIERKKSSNEWMAYVKTLKEKIDSLEAAQVEGIKKGVSLKQDQENLKAVVSGYAKAYVDGLKERVKQDKRATLGVLRTTGNAI